MQSTRPRTANTTDVYVQKIPEGVEAVMEVVNTELRVKPKLVAAS